MLLGQLDEYRGRFDSYITPYIKIHSRCIIDLSVKGKKIKLLQGSIEELHDLKVEKECLTNTNHKGKDQYI